MDQRGEILYRVTLLEILMTLITMYNEETFLQDFLVILKRTLEDMSHWHHIDGDMMSYLTSPNKLL